MTSEDCVIVIMASPIYTGQDPNRCSKNHRLFVPSQQSAISGKPCANRLNPLFRDFNPTMHRHFRSICYIGRLLIAFMLIRFFQTVSHVNPSIIFVREDLLLFTSFQSAFTRMDSEFWRFKNQNEISQPPGEQLARSDLQNK